MWRSFWCAAVAAITLKTLNPFGNGSLVLVNLLPPTPCLQHRWGLFEERIDQTFCPVRRHLHQELPLLGIRHLCYSRHLWSKSLNLLLPTKAAGADPRATQGVYGAIFSRLNILWSKHIRQGTWIKSHPIVEVFLVSHSLYCSISADPPQLSSVNMGTRLNGS